MPLASVKGVFYTYSNFSRHRIEIQVTIHIQHLKSKEFTAVCFTLKATTIDVLRHYS